MNPKPFHPQKLFALLGLSVSWAISASFISQAGEPLYLVTHSHTLVLGTILSTNQTSTQLQPHLTITRQKLDDPISIRHDDVKTLFAPGDKVIISIRPEGWSYRLSHGAFQVSSLNPKTLKILKGSLGGGDLIAFQWYINTCGQEKEFSYGGDRYFVQQADGKIIPISKLHQKEWIPLRKASPSEMACSKLYQAKQSSQIYSLIPWLIGILMGLGGAYWTYQILKLRFTKL